MSFLFQATEISSGGPVDTNAAYTYNPPWANTQPYTTEQKAELCICQASVMPIGLDCISFGWATHDGAGFASGYVQDEEGAIHSFTGVYTVESDVVTPVVTSMTLVAESGIQPVGDPLFGDWAPPANVYSAFWERFVDAFEIAGQRYEPPPPPEPPPEFNPDDNMFSVSILVAELYTDAYGDSVYIGLGYEGYEEPLGTLVSSPATIMGFPIVVNYVGYDMYIEGGVYQDSSLFVGFESDIDITQIDGLSFSLTVTNFAGTVVGTAEAYFDSFADNFSGGLSVELQLDPNWEVGDPVTINIVVDVP
jgi:hypothetical protein